MYGDGGQVFYALQYTVFVNAEKRKELSEKNAGVEKCRVVG